eukprot:Hpha_TRINITY_DN15711_c1_g8::TRINITY_DN15711_c1_g8_i1::g.39097::m.39097
MLSRAGRPVVPGLGRQNRWKSFFASKSQSGPADGVTWKRTGEVAKVFDTDKVYARGHWGDFWDWTRYLQKNHYYKYDHTTYSDTPPPFPNDPRTTAQEIQAWRKDYEKWVAELGRPLQTGRGKPVVREAYLTHADHEKYMTEVFPKFSHEERAVLGATDPKSKRAGTYVDVHGLTCPEEPEAGIPAVHLNPGRELNQFHGCMGYKGWFILNSKGEFTQSGHKSICPQPS